MCCLSAGFALWLNTHHYVPNQMLTIVQVSNFDDRLQECADTFQ